MLWKISDNKIEGSNKEVMAGPYVPFDYDNAKYLMSLPLVKGKLCEADVSEYVPSTAKDILVYLFLTFKTADRTHKRAVYEIYTQDNSGTKYTQLMNAAFPENDFVMNSANLWLPLVGDKKVVYIRIPDTWTSNSSLGKENVRSYKCLNDAMKSYAQGGEDIFTGVFLMGYKG